MSTLILKSKVKNLTKDALFLRWLGDRGQHLAAGEEVVVDGAYPSAVSNRRFVSSCVYDVEQGRVGLTLVTTLKTEAPPKEEVAAASEDVRRQGFVPPAGSIKPGPDAAPAADKKEKVDERWGQGTIEQQKPEPITLPGHEDALAYDKASRGVETEGAPKTVDIFNDGPTVTDETAQDNQATDAATPAPATATEVSSDAPAKDTAKPKAKSDTTPKKRGGRRKSSTDAK